MYVCMHICIVCITYVSRVYYLCIMYVLRMYECMFLLAPPQEKNDKKNLIAFRLPLFLCHASVNVTVAVFDAAPASTAV